MNTRSDFYQTHLNDVSRSFSFCIAQLKSPLKEWVGLSYLLLRVLDTIEDSAWISQAEKIKAFSAFDSALDGSSFTHYLPALVSQVPVAELKLYNDFPILVRDFNALPESIQSSIRSTVLNMSRGMQYFSLKYPQQGLRLNSLKEVNQYCFFVAGIIGELLTQLIRNFSDSQNLNQNLMTNSIRFGLCLQKINILKDQKEDESQGRFLVPNRSELLHSFTEDAHGALLYL
ncbi:MAG: squalene/phytoene synthase family protein, partial [Bdellovibrionales bacterium]